MNTLSANQSYRTKAAQMKLNTDDILRIDIDSNIIFGETDMQHLIDGALAIGNGRKFRNLIVIGDGSTADTEARALSASIEGSIYKIADAFVIKSLAQKLLMNVYVKFQKPAVPTKFFFNEKEAINWLKDVN